MHRKIWQAETLKAYIYLFIKKKKSQSARNASPPQGFIDFCVEFIVALYLGKKAQEYEEYFLQFVLSF